MYVDKSSIYGKIHHIACCRLKLHASGALRSLVTKDNASEKPMKNQIYEQLIAHPSNRPRAVTWCEAWETASDGVVYHARVQCHHPQDPIAVELCKGLAEKRARYLASIRPVKHENSGVK